MHKTKQPIESNESKKFLWNIPDEHNIPQRRSELRRLYKRLVNRLRRDFSFVVKDDTQPIKSDPSLMKEDERTLLTKKCKHLIRSLNTCIGLHGAPTASQD